MTRIYRSNAPLLGSAALLLLLLHALGCQPAVEAPLRSSTQTSAAGIEPPIAAASDASGELVEDVWDAYSMRDAATGQAARIGYAHTTVQRVNEGGRQLVRTTSQVHTAMQRSGQNISQDLALTSWDTPEGELVRFESRTSGAGGEIVSAGSVKDGKLEIQTATLGRTQPQQLPWPAGSGGPFAVEQSLRQKPLKPGEKRSVLGLMPMLNLPVTWELVAGDYEEVELPAAGAARREKLLKVEATMNLGTQKIESQLWVSASGQTQKTLIPSIGQETVRTTKEDALRQTADKPYDLFVASTVPLTGPFDRLPAARRAVYRARLKNGSIEGLFSEGPTQKVEQIDDRTALITVLSGPPGGESGGGAAQTPSPAAQTPSPDDLGSNNFIQVDDPLIQKLAASVQAATGGPWQTALALEKLVADMVQNKSYSQAFATAAEVARTAEGDCTEHAVLLAALCRAKNIPARCAFGLVFYPPEKGFAYHMWNEVFIGGRWVALDATLGQGRVASDHIKLGDSNLAGGSPLAELLSVMQVFGRLELEVIEQE